MAANSTEQNLNTKLFIIVIGDKQYKMKLSNVCPRGTVAYQAHAYIVPIGGWTADTQTDKELQLQEVIAERDALLAERDALLELMTMEDLDTMIQLKKDMWKPYPKKKEKKENEKRGGKAKGREAEFRFITEKGGIIEHKLKGHIAEATYIGDEKFRYIFNGVEKTGKISGFCKAHAEELIRTGTQCSKAYNGWDACNIKGWGSKGQWGQ